MTPAGHVARASASASRSGIRSGSLQWWCRMSHTTGRPIRSAKASTSRRANLRSSFSTTRREAACSQSCSKPRRSGPSRPRGRRPRRRRAAPPRTRARVPSREQLALDLQLDRARRRMSASSELSTVYCPGWSQPDPRSRASAPISARRAAWRCGASRNCGRSGCGVRRQAVAIRYMRMSWSSQ